MARYFLAVAPPEPQLSQVDALRARWGHPHHKVEPHVTIKAPFLWSGAPDQFLAPVADALASIAPFDCRLGGTGRFPGAKVLYLKVAGDGLLPLHMAVVQALAGLLPPDGRPSHEGERYTPHLTLAVGRFGIDVKGLEAMEVEAKAELAALAPFTVSALRCYRWSEAGRWERHQDIPLGGLV